MQKLLLILGLSLFLLQPKMTAAEELRNPLALAFTIPVISLIVTTIGFSLFQDKEKSEEEKDEYSSLRELPNTFQHPSPLDNHFPQQ